VLFVVNMRVAVELLTRPTCNVQLTCIQCYLGTVRYSNQPVTMPLSSSSSSDRSMVLWYEARNAML
jgi:hypothetical protein